MAVKVNPLLKRKEVRFKVEHAAKEKTPGRLEVKKALAAELKLNEELVFIKKMQTLTGTNITVGIANAYETTDQAKLVEPEYIRKRNNPPEEQKGEVAT